MTRPLKGLVAATALATVLAGCQVDTGYGPKHLQPLSYAIKADMTAKNMSPRDPILVRLFKEESALEVWKRTETGKFALLKTYEICKWSGELGPKFKEGDRQAPEGFYTIRPAQMNPNSSYHLSFNMGYPNAYDRSYGRTGSHLMVHGACSSRGCYAMTDEQIQEIYSLARESFRGGQRDFQVEAFPFRMTAENMARHDGNEHMPFWRMLKRGYDHFEVTRLMPKVDVCGKQYIFDAQLENSSDKFVADRACPAYKVEPSIEMAVAAKQRIDDEKTTVLIAQLAEKHEREERWKNGDTALAKIFNGGANAQTDAEQSTAAGASAAGNAAGSMTPALAYAETPVPAPNPTRMFQAKPSNGLFSGLFKRDATPEATAPAADVPEADVPQQAARTPVFFTRPSSPPEAAGAPETAVAPETQASQVLETPQSDALLTTQSIAAPKPKAEPAEKTGKSNFSAVSDVMSRWFSGSKPAK